MPLGFIPLASTVSAYAVASTIGRYRLPPRHSARHSQHYRPIPLASASSHTPLPALSADIACREVSQNVVADSVYAGPPLRTPLPALSADSACRHVIPHVTASTFGRYRLPRGFHRLLEPRRRLCVCRRRLCVRRCPHYRPISLAARFPQTSPSILRMPSPTLCTPGRLCVRRYPHYRPIPLAATSSCTSSPALSADTACLRVIPHVAASTFGRYRWRGGCEEVRGRL